MFQNSGIRVEGAGSGTLSMTSAPRSIGGIAPWFRVSGSGFRVSGAGFRVQGSGFGFRVQGSGFRVRVQGSGFGVQVLGFRISGFETCWMSVILSAVKRSFSDPTSSAIVTAVTLSPLQS